MPAYSKKFQTTPKFFSLSVISPSNTSFISKKSYERIINFIDSEIRGSYISLENGDIIRLKDNTLANKKYAYFLIDNNYDALEKMFFPMGFLLPITLQKFISIKRSAIINLCYNESSFNALCNKSGLVKIIS